ncbi:MAG: deaminase [Patescibacteria group bacterium]
MKRIIFAYIPVIHQGYLNFFDKYKGLDLYIMGRDVAYMYRSLEKDIRAVKPETIKDMVEKLRYFNTVEVADENDLVKLKDLEIVMPDEDYMHMVQEKYFPDAKVVYDSVFLRWDSDNSLKKHVINPDHTVSTDKFDREMLKKAHDNVEKSGDWWRQIGGLIVKNGEIILIAYNRHVPHPDMPYINGDPRASFKKGMQVELSTALHSEAQMVAEAARRGICLAGTSMYVTTFPCPPCAKLIAFSGIKKLFYKEGYAMLDGESILKSQGVEIVRVE